MDNARIFLKNELSGFSSRNAFSALFVCAIETCIFSFAVSQYVYLIVFEVAGSGMYYDSFIFRKLKIPCLHINSFIPKIDNNTSSESNSFQCHSFDFW